MTPEERAAAIQWPFFEVGDRDVVDFAKLRAVIVSLIKAAVEDARREEREACAKVAESLNSAAHLYGPAEFVKKVIAAEIRKRS